MEQDVIEALRQHRPEFEELGVEHLRLFGSVARGKARPDSDVDVLATFKPSARPGLKVVRLHRRLEEILGRPVDLLRAPVTRPDLKKTIEEEGVNAF